MPHSDGNTVKVKVALPQDSPPGGGAEWIWADEVGKGLYRVKNVPFFAKGLSFGDVVRADVENDALIFREVVWRGGHSTYRIFASHGREQPDVLALLKQLNNMHCTYEAANTKLVGIDVPPEVDVHDVYRALEEAENKGTIDFQEGHCGHPLNKNRAPL